jgi:hypothetical protein
MRNHSLSLKIQRTQSFALPTVNLYKIITANSQIIFLFSDMKISLSVLFLSLLENKNLYVLYGKIFLA